MFPATTPVAATLLVVLLAGSAVAGPLGEDTAPSVAAASSEGPKQPAPQTERPEEPKAEDPPKVTFTGQTAFENGDGAESRVLDPGTPKRLDVGEDGGKTLLRDIVMNEMSAGAGGGAVNRVRRRVLPNYIPVCKRKDPELVECIKKAVETLRPRLRKGISKLRVPALEPLRFPALSVQRNLAALRVNASLKDIFLEGAGDFRLDGLKVDVVDKSKLSAGVNISFAMLRVQTEYDILGQLLGVPLQGKGIFRGNFSDVFVFAEGSGSAAADGIGVKELRMRLKLGDSKVDIENHDAAAAAISDRAAAFIRANTNDVLEVVRPVAEETAAEVVLQMAESIFKRLPLEEILPDE